MGSQFAELIQGRTVRGKIHRVLATLFVVMLISTAGYLAHSQRVLVEGQVERQARDLADGYFDNIHRLMLTGGMADRDVVRNTLLSRPDVIDAHIMRGPAAVKGLGSGGESAQVVDDLDRRALVGETVSEIRDGAEGRVLTVLVPLRDLQANAEAMLPRLHFENAWAATQAIASREAWGDLLTALDALDLTAATEAEAASAEILRQRATEAWDAEREEWAIDLFEDNARKADDRVERCAQLVGDVG